MTQLFNPVVEAFRQVAKAVGAGSVQPCPALRLRHAPAVESELTCWRVWPLAVG